VRSDYTWNGSSWVVSAVTRYLYDGMLVVQERDGSNNPLVAYTRGKDLSGSLQGAGGIGGLLARTHGYSGGSWSTHSYYHADALGNVSYLINSSQSMVASYKYDPYGRTISSSGTLASANVMRFSSKLAMDASSMGLYYYGYRFYEPKQGRWVNRDPIGEGGGDDLYGFVRNWPMNGNDRLGLQQQGVYTYVDEDGNVETVAASAMDGDGGSGPPPGIPTCCDKGCLASASSLN